MNNFHQADSDARLQQTLIIGTISEVDNANRCLRVQSSELTTGWLPYPATIGNNFIAWTPMRVGTQVLLACPSGDLTQAIIVSILYTDNLAPPSNDPAVDIIQFNDGTVIKKDASTITVSSPCALDINVGGTVSIVAGGDMTLKAPNIFLN